MNGVLKTNLAQRWAWANIIFIVIFHFIAGFFEMLSAVGESDGVS